MHPRFLGFRREQNELSFFSILDEILFAAPKEEDRKDILSRRKIQRRQLSSTQLAYYTNSFGENEDNSFEEILDDPTHNIIPEECKE